jgi:hypothetical protein
MLKAMIELIPRAREVLREEGAGSVLKRGLPIVKSWFFEYGNYYLYEHILEDGNEADFLPKIKNFTFNTVSSNEEADALAQSTGVDFRKHFIDSRKRLEKGAIAFCVFIDGEAAHTGWVALNEEARKSVDSLPYEIDFANGEACTGGTGTLTKYRGKRLMVYGYFKRFQFLWEKGVKISRNAVDVRNIASQRVHAKFNHKIYARARYLKILWWKSWKELPVLQTERCA